MPALQAANIPGIQPTTSPNAPSGAGLTDIVGGALRGASQFLSDTTQSQRVQAAADQKRADATAIGEVLGDFAGEQASFIEASVQNQQLREAAQQVIDEGGELGESGLPVLAEATRLKDAQQYLEETGQMSTLNQLRILRKQQFLISKRPDLGEDIVRLTNSVASDSNAILKRNEDEARKAEADQRNSERAAIDTILKQANDYNPADNWQVKKEKAQQYQYIAREKQAAIDMLDSLKRDAEHDSLDVEAGGREITRIQQTNTRASLDAVRNQLVPATIGESVVYATSLTERVDLTPDQRLTEFDKFVVAQEQTLISSIPDPSQQSQALASFRQTSALQRQRVSGKQLDDTVSAELHANAAQAGLAFNKAAGPQVVGFLQIARDLGPALETVMGRGPAQKAMLDMAPKIMTAAASLGVSVPDQQIAGIPNPAGRTTPFSTRANIPNLGADSPYLLPGQQPNTVSDKQVYNSTGTLLDMIKAAAGTTDRPSTPSMKVAAVVAVERSLTDPVVFNDRANAQRVIQGLADPGVAPAFKDNPNGTLAANALQRQIQRLSLGTYQELVRVVGEQSGNTALKLDDFATLTQNDQGEVVLRVKPGYPLQPAVADRVQRELNAQVKAWAHVHGHTDYKQAAQELY